MLQKINYQYQRIEGIFFVSYFVVLPIITRLQYAKYFEESLTTSIIYYILSGILTILIYLIYYKFILPKFLFTKKYIWFFLSLVVFIFFSAAAFYLINIVINYLLYNSGFFSERTSIDGALTTGFPSIISISISLTTYNLLSLTALGYFIKAIKEEYKYNQIKEGQLKLELKSLRAQLQPHFFFNTLNNIYSLALQNSSDTANTISRLSDLMRYVLYECNQNTVPLEQEIEFIKNYIKLEQIRHHNNVKITCDFQGKMDHIFISPLLIMPLIENSFKHGINEDISDCSLSIIISVIDNEIIVEVKNTKPFIINVNKKKQNGIGLENLKKRLTLLYPQKHSLSFLETENNYEVYLTLSMK